MIEVGIVGGTGYTGAELLRLLTRHPEVRLRAVTSRGQAGVAVAELFPSLRGRVEARFSEPALEELAACDVVFFATPNGTAMEWAPALLDAGTRVIDLGADFRLRDPEAWARWYGLPHACPDYLAKAVYGLSEHHRGVLRSARLVANPGCYPTAVALGLLPLLEAGLVAGPVVADCKSGASGAGRQAKVATLFCEVDESLKAYGADGHRHLPEIRQTLAEVAGADVAVTFVPHLIPMARGMQASLYVPLAPGTDDLQALYAGRYAEEPFVDVMPPGSHPETRSVRGTNDCRVAVRRAPDQPELAVVFAVIDNLTKGAAGQAVQNMNLAFGIDETTGLDDLAVLP